MPPRGRRSQKVTKRIAAATTNITRREKSETRGARKRTRKKG